MKRKYMIGLVLSFALLVTSFTYASSNRAYNFNDLSTKMVEESLESQSSDLKAKLLKLRYEEGVKDYDKLKENVENSRKYMEIMKQQKEHAQGEYSTDDKEVGFQTFHAALHEYNAAKKNYQNLVKQEIQLMQSLENMKLQRQQAPRKKQQEIEKTRIHFQRDYYNVFLLQERLKLAQTNLNNLDRQIKIEKTKVSLDMTTALSLRALENQRVNLALSLQELESNIELMKESIKTKLGMAVEDNLEVVYEVSHRITFLPLTLNDHIENFKSNSLDLETVKKNSEIQREIFQKTKVVYEPEDNQYLIAELEILEAELNEKTLERNMELMVKQAYFNYKKAADQITVQIENKTLVEEEIKQLELKYKTGQVSLLQYEMQSIQHQQSLVDYNQSLVIFLNTKADLELLTKGIQP